MKYFYAGVWIWFKTLFFNASFFGAGAMLMGNWDMFSGSFLVFICSLFVTLPLLLVIIPLVKLSTKIPYRIQARMAWLTFNLMLLIISFYMFFLFMDGGFENIEGWVLGLMGTTIAGLLVAIFTSNRRLTKLNNENINQEI